MDKPYALVRQNFLARRLSVDPNVLLVRTVGRMKLALIKNVKILVPVHVASKQDALSSTTTLSARAPSATQATHSSDAKL